MLGAIAGDIIGSLYEINNIKTKDFLLLNPDSIFTDDTVLTVAVADKLLDHSDYEEIFKSYYHRYSARGYGKSFHRWAKGEIVGAYNSYGNGSAMRVSPVGYAFDNLEQVLAEAKISAEITHNHPEGIKGAQAVAAIIFLARTGTSREEIKSYTETNFGYELNQSLDEIRPTYKFDVSCQGSVPQAIIAFLESTDFEDAIRNAISIGGDSDTISCITGGIAEAFYGSVPTFIAEYAISKITKHLYGTIEKFQKKYCN
ncbi:ADP-ribosylglycohydrolase family protein [Anabaena sphaerica FACHB-251]|uniref:ADP-ribosylglycohydrolase family protein n=2 Tax=Anabaena TaxID=1163 RepID=A0A926WIX6_9NOST|nr:ADP-ribosylglycohydrolase family protein [Anabaena sphaerica]MBD2294296.1 ADP-ribosylglycohydrolase family protein [Anabaena sphaerica FACHB-251]